MSSNDPFRRPHHFHLSCYHGARRGSLCLTLPNSPAPRCSHHDVELWELRSLALGWLCPTVSVQPHQNAGQASKTSLCLPNAPWLKGFFWPWKPTMMKSPSAVFSRTSTTKESRSATILLAEFQGVLLKIYNPNIFIKFDQKASLKRFQEYHRLLTSSGEPLLSSGFGRIVGKYSKIPNSFGLRCQTVACIEARRMIPYCPYLTHQHLQQCWSDVT